MKFKDYVNAMEKGKKIRRKRWNKEHFWCMDIGVLRNSKNEIIDDWEIFEDKKSLSDKGLKHQIILKNGDSVTLTYPTCLLSSDVEKAIKELLEYIYQTMELEDSQWINIKAKEIFGERLVE